VAPDPATIAAASEPASVGNELELYRPSPNPFERTTRFAYAITAGTEQVDIGVFDLAGRRIRSLAQGPRSVGRYEVAWDGRTDSGSRVRNGVYFLRASMGTELRVARITYLVK
jgi:flagellar hook assembly protein FlgD